VAAAQEHSGTAEGCECGWLINRQYINSEIERVNAQSRCHPLGVLGARTGKTGSSRRA
jgi:hypothetical protein